MKELRTYLILLSIFLALLTIVVLVLEKIGG